MLQQFHQQLTNLRDWHRTNVGGGSAAAPCCRRHSRPNSFTCRSSRRDFLTAGGVLLASGYHTQQVWGGELSDGQQGGAPQPVAEALPPPDYTMPGPFTPMRLPKLEHIASSAFPACLGNQCLLRVNAFYPKASGSGATPPYPLAIFSGGFLVPSAKYVSYATRLASWGFVVILYDKVESAGLEMSVLNDLVSVALVRDLITWTTTDAILSHLTSPDQGVYLCGHSRGGKVSVLTAAMDERVTALCLLDPVDNTKYAPLSTGFPSAVEALRQLGMQDKPQRAAVPMAVVGASLSVDCAPKDANFRLFYDACAAPAWQVSVPDAGHFQFLDEKSALDRAVCLEGKTPDPVVRAISQAALVAWAEIMVRRRYVITDRKRLLADASEQLQGLLAPPRPPLDLSQKNVLVV